MNSEEVIRVLNIHRDRLVIVPTLIPHSQFGDENCGGTLTGMHGAKLAEIICNECGAVVAYVAGDLRQTLNKLESQLELATGQCQHCGSVNLFPGLSRVEAAVSIPVIALRWKATMNRETVRDLWPER
jgi:hypothetical protein